MRSAPDIVVHAARILEASSAGLLLLDRGGRILSANAAASDAVGVPASALSGRDLAALVTADHAPATATLLDSALHTGRASAEIALGAGDAARWWRVDLVDIGEALVATLTDITPLRLADAELAAERRLLQAVVEQLPVGLAIVDSPGGAIRMHNAEAIRLLGHPMRPSDTYAGYAQYGAEHADGSPYAAHEYPTARALLAGEQVRDEEMRYRRGDGRPTWFTVSAAPVRAADGTVIAAVCTWTDIAERKAREERLLLGERQLRLIADRLPALVSYIDADQRYVFANANYRDWFGLDPATMTGMTVRELLGPTMHDRIAPRLREALSGRTVSFVDELRLPDGSRRNVEGAYVPDHDQTGTVRGFVVLAYDVTERERQRSQLERSNAELENFAAIAAHDLREPLRMVSAFLGRLDTAWSVGRDQRLDGYLRHALAGATRLSLLITRMLDFAKVGAAPPAPEPVDAGAVARDVVALLAEAIAEAGATVAVGPLPTVRCHPVELARVLQNLIANALKFRGERPPQVRITGTVADGVARLALHDNGIGIPPEAQARLFQPFVRLDRRYEGTGLGLVICRQVLARYGGTITVASTPGTGTVFTITLPAVLPDPAG